MRHRILVVEDEPAIAESLDYALRREGFTTRIAATYAKADEARAWPTLIILDLMLPDGNGRDLLHTLRAESRRTPVIVLSSRESEGDRISALEGGADDYVTKPFSPREVVARVHAILRRTRGEHSEDTTIRFADLVMDEDTREVWRGDEPLQLTATEFNLLRFFMRNPKRVLSKAQILDAVWHYDFGGNPNVVETYVSYLRKKLDRLGPPLIQTIRLVGYALREPER